MPATEKSVFVFLMKHLWPTHEMEWILEKWTLRKSKASKQIEEEAKLNLEANFSDISDILTEDDMKQIHDVIEESRRRVVEKYSEPKCTTAVVTADRGSEVDLDFAKTSKPKKTLLTKETRLHWRWQGTMKERSVLPKLISRSWQAGMADGPTGKTYTEVEALTIVLKTLWEWHAAEPDADPCPHNWDDPNWFFPGPR